MPQRSVWWILWLLGGVWGGRAISFYPAEEQPFNGTTTLEEQATAGRDVPDDRNRLFNGNRFRPPLIGDNAIAGGGNFGQWRPPPGALIRPRPPNINVIPPPPPPIYDQPAPDKFYQLDFPGSGGLGSVGGFGGGGGGYGGVGGFGGGSGGGGYYPGDYVNPYSDQCNIIGPLIALKKALFKIIKLAAVKLPLIALKVVTKTFAFLVIIGPILLPLLLLFPVPVYGFVNGFTNINTGFGNSFANNNPNQNTGNLNNNNLNRNPNNPNNLGRGTGRLLPPFAKGPCFPRLACEMGFWGFQTQVAWMLDHVHETLTPTFPKIFFTWRRAYHQGGKGRDCNSLYFCPKIDQLIRAAKDYKFLPEEENAKT